MAIVQRTVQVQSDFANANWTKNKLIDALETVFTDAGLHGAAVTGQVKGWDDGTTQYTYYDASDPAQCSGGGTLPASLENSNDPSTTNTTDFRSRTFRNLPCTGGSGSGATFDVHYNGGTLYRVIPCNPGSGYTNGDVLTISAASILGTSNGAADVTVTVKVDTTNYGGTSAFFQKQAVQTSTYPWAVLKVDNDPTKKYGSTYYFIQVVSDTQIQITSGFFWAGWQQQFTGAYRMDTWEATGETNWTLGDLRKTDQNTYYGSNYSRHRITYATTASYPLYIKTAQAQAPQDSNFAIFSFAQTDIPSTDHMNDLYYGSFTIPKYTTSVYNNDHVGHCGVIDWINGTSNTATFSQRYNVCTNSSNSAMPRAAETGWAERIASAGYYNPSLYDGFCNFTWRAHKDNDTGSNARLYYVETAKYAYDEFNSDSEYTNVTSLPYQAAGGYVFDASVEYKSVIKGIPINPYLLPSPYTIPDDFVVLEIVYNTPSAKFLPGDTITVSGSEAYTILVGGYNNTDADETRGVFLCGRTI